MPTLANGHVGFVIYGNSILMNGLYNGVRGESHRARIPNYANVMPNVECDGNCIYQLNMRKGYFQNTINGSNFKVIQQLYAHRYYNRAIINSFTLERTKQGGNVSVELAIEHGNEISVDLRLLNSTEHTELNSKINCYETRLLEDVRYQTSPSEVCIGYTVPPAKLFLNENETTVTFQHITVVAKTQEEVLKELQDINQATDVFEKHTSVWEEHWKRFGIFVEGNSKVNEIIHSSMFYLISNLPSEETNQPKDPFYGLSPGGLPKGGQVHTEYQGHSFWDTEIWMHPPILLLNPKWSEEILSYRYNVKKAAADNAWNTNYKGYRYPWESGFTGCEVTPDCCPEVVEFQHHIIADIAFAFRSHLAATHDDDWWNSFGCDIAYNTARFWESRVRFNQSTQFYDIRSELSA
jgi:trehalose/maltose hydrolase-like predicted phosphorylase